MLSLYRSATVRPRSCVSGVSGTTRHVSRTASSTCQTWLIGQRRLRTAKLANSLRTWTLTTPPVRSSRAAISAFVASSDAKYATTFVSKNALVTVFIPGPHSIPAIELVVSRQLVGHVPHTLEQLVDSQLSFDLDNRGFLVPGGTHVDPVALLQAKGGSKFRGQTNSQAISPLGNPHLHRSAPDIH